MAEDSSKCSKDEVVHDWLPFFQIYKDGSVKRFINVDHTKPGFDPVTGVLSYDIVLATVENIRARLYVPELNGPDQKLPLLIHYHGGGFCVGSPFDQVCGSFMQRIIAGAKVIGLSVDYRLAPENRLPVGYDDSWFALEWVASHVNGQGPIPVLNKHVDPTRVFIIGESSGGTVAYNVAMQAGRTPIPEVSLMGLILVHPFFIGKNEVQQMYKFMCPSSSGSEDDPRINPAVEPNLKRLGCRKVLVFVAGADPMRDPAVKFYETLKESEWAGQLELFETEGEDHVFHMFNPTCEKAHVLMNRLFAFLHED